MPGHRYVVCGACGINQHAHGLCAIWCRYPGGDTANRLDRNGKPRTEATAVVCRGNHHRDLQTVNQRALHGKAHQPTTVYGHEVDRLAGGKVCRHDKVTLVLAILIIDDDDLGTSCKGIDGLIKRR